MENQNSQVKETLTDYEKEKLINTLKEDKVFSINIFTAIFPFMLNHFKHHGD